ncbi:hypothetical protein RPE78_04830 [Thioclava litoralis]|uniref:DUF1127 domain-containing protein n=1 Tax=Thioclava litoralis TaxID=3076557 RepID=A0ABZ1E0N7_9RHOB|nr:hypothetical protein RPE78_04830 [Thioclava sp. FTW29]
MHPVFTLSGVLSFLSVRRDPKIDARLTDLGLRKARKHSCPISPFRPVSPFRVVHHAL